ncbi:hypothetical protein ACFSW8_12410 [Rubritalea tangerina]|uniref:Uncharacterized protein n=2 Tax=Rubritalea tangerina TaxID=430798 RepID=A0ABW4ZCG2_9BACT
MNKTTILLCSLALLLTKTLVAQNTPFDKKETTPAPTEELKVNVSITAVSLPLSTAFHLLKKNDSEIYNGSIKLLESGEATIEKVIAFKASDQELVIYRSQRSQPNQTEEKADLKSMLKTSDTIETRTAFENGTWSVAATINSDIIVNHSIPGHVENFQYQATRISAPNKKPVFLSSYQPQNSNSNSEGKVWLYFLTITEI